LIGIGWGIGLRIGEVIASGPGWAAAGIQMQISAVDNFLTQDLCILLLRIQLFLFFADALKGGMWETNVKLMKTRRSGRVAKPPGLTDLTDRLGAPGADPGGFAREYTYG